MTSLGEQSHPHSNKNELKRTTKPGLKPKLKTKARKMHMLTNTSTILATLALTSTAMADFTGYDGTFQIYNDGVDDWCVIDIYATFDEPTNAVLNIFNANVTTGTEDGFHHNDLADAQGGSFKPSFSFEIPGAYDPMRDSYVTIGYGVGASAALNQTALDPNFGDGLGPDIPEGAGWFNLTPDNAQYAINGAVHIAHFVMEYTFQFPEDFYFQAEIGYNNGPGTDVQFGDGVFAMIPAPGSIALLGFAGVRARRRRR